MKTILPLFRLSLLLGLLVSCGPAPVKIDQNDYIGILPTPQIELPGQEYIPLNKHGISLSVFFRNIETKMGSPVNEGVNVLNKRLRGLGHPKLGVAENLDGNSNIIVEKISESELIEILKENGTKDDISSKQLSQAYYIKVKESQDNGEQVSIKVSDDIGLYYAFISISQLICTNESGHLIIPEIEIADWPEIGLRLAKTSASNNPTSTLRLFNDWMSLYKINMVGLQFHGEESKNLGLFEENINTICPREEKRGLLETIVYFCPFRGNGYNFQLSSDKENYAELINWVFDNGAHGFEVDYNDWPDQEDGPPAEEVVTFAYNEVVKNNPDAYVLYCPPNTGPAQYRGEASKELVHILSNIPGKVWPLWTGMTTRLEKRLTPELVQDWSNATGRRPFFWLNRVSIGSNLSFSRSLNDTSNDLIVPGERLPKDLNLLFEGIHLNFVFASGDKYLIPNVIGTEELIYFATVADYIWNPHGWEANESYNRAMKFVEIMEPIMTGQ